MDKVGFLYDTQLYIVSTYVFYIALSRFFIQYIPGYNGLSLTLFIIIGYIFSNTTLLISSVFRYVSKVLAISSILSSSYALLLFFYDMLSLYRDIYIGMPGVLIYLYHLASSISPLFCRRFRTLYSMPYLNTLLLSLPTLPVLAYLMDISAYIFRYGSADWIVILEDLHRPKNIMAIETSVILSVWYYLGNYLRVKRIEEALNINIEKVLWVPRIYSHSLIKYTYTGRYIFYIRSYGYGFQVFTRLHILKASISIDKFRMLLSRVSKLSIIYDCNGLLYLHLYVEGAFLHYVFETIMDTLDKLRGSIFMYRLAEDPGYRVSKAYRYMKSSKKSNDIKTDSIDLVNKIYIFRPIDSSEDSSESRYIIGVGIYNIERYGEEDIHDAEVYEYYKLLNIYSLIDELFKSVQQISLTE